jgi:hypothetical protein
MMGPKALTMFLDTLGVKSRHRGCHPRGYIDNSQMRCNTGELSQVSGYRLGTTASAPPSSIVHLIKPLGGVAAAVNFIIFK